MDTPLPTKTTKIEEINTFSWKQKINLEVFIASHYLLLLFMSLCNIGAKPSRHSVE